MRGHSETAGNCHQLLMVRSHDVPELAVFLKRRNSFLSHEIQNEILELMADDVLRSIIRIRIRIHITFPSLWTKLLTLQPRNR